VGAKFARAEARSAYAAISRIAFKFGKIVDYYHANPLNFIKFNAWQGELRACPCVIGV
jgi:hypothetical protein